MKRIMITTVFAILAAAVCYAQDKSTAVRAKGIVRDFPVEVAYSKTTLLVFPAPIQDADRGDASVLAERMEGVENILKLKAGIRDFEPSNLHVVTGDGKVYAFTVSYNENPAELTIDMGKQPPHSPVTFDGVSLNSRELELAAATIKGIPSFISGVRRKRYGMEVKLEAILVKQDVLFFRYKLKNNTRIAFGQSDPRFYIRDKKRAKRTAVQETEVAHVFIQRSGTPESPDGQTIIVAFPRFTIAENKLFVTEIMEQSGDRNLECRVDQKKLLQAKSVN